LRVFERRPLPTAMVIQDEFMAHDLFRQCHQRGIRVPEDLSVVALADSAPQAHLVPLSAPNTAAMWVDAARRAAHHLCQLMTNGGDKQIEVVLHAPIQWKQSTGRPNPATFPTGQRGSN